MLRVIVTGCDDPGAADKVTTHVFLRRPDDCIEYMDAMLSPRCMSVGTNTMRKQVAFAMDFSVFVNYHKPVFKHVHATKLSPK
jgi:hypothetical protein